MTVLTLPFGTESASQDPNSSDNRSSTSRAAETLDDLLKCWEQVPPKEIKMLRSTCGVLSNLFGISTDQLSISEVFRSRGKLRPFLEARKYAENSIRTYVNHVRILLKSAQALGWRADKGIPAAWSAVVIQAIKRECGDVARDLAAQRKTPNEVTLDDVEAWTKSAVASGSSFERTREKASWFWQTMHDCGHTKCLPLSIRRKKKYGIPLSQFPTGLRNEVESLLDWKLAEYAVDRPKDARHRPVTSERLRQVVSALYGFAVNVRGESEIDSLVNLVKQPIVSHFAMWCINDRKVKGQTLQRNLRLIGAIFAQHPSYKGVNLSWFKPFLDGLPVERESESKERKAEKYLEYSVLESIPGKIREEGRLVAKRKPEKASRFIMEALLLKWLTILPWRQKNIRQCRISGVKPNLYKSKIQPFSTLARPDWVIEEERRNPDAEFWQFKFSHQETKMKNDVHALLPKQLIGPLEEYLVSFRPLLIQGADPGTLFVNRAGNPMALSEMTLIVSQRTQQYGGRRVTPHLFRDIIAFTWLEAHPQDYLTVSKLLWHTSINTTLRVYGSRFNESSAVSRMEMWLDTRGTEMKQL